MVATGERRVVTVLFADLVGFTSLAEDRDPEVVHDLIDAALTEVVGVVQEHGGTIDKILGDGVLALFGAPHAHEDDPERAVRAALAIRDLVASKSWSGSKLAIRVGINTGEVLVGGLHAGEDYTAMGDVVNSSSRLQTLAKPNQVLVGSPTHDQTSHAISYIPVGDLALKGKSTLVGAYVAEAALTTPGRRPSRPRAALVGREAEAELAALFIKNSLAVPKASCILLQGEAGVGKSRLAEEVAQDAALAHSAIVMEGRCVPYGEANNFWPIAEALSSLVTLQPSDTPEARAIKINALVADALSLDRDHPDVRRVSTGLGLILGNRSKPTAIDSEQVPTLATQSLVRVLAGLAQMQPVVLVISDLRWASDSLLELLTTALEGLRHSPFVLIGTARPEFDRTLVSNSISLLSLGLDPLNEETTRLLISQLGGASISEEVAAMIHERSGGLPLFVEELISLFKEQAASELHPSKQALSLAREVPSTLRGVLSARLDSLDAQERRAISDASVLGRTGSTEILSALWKATGVEEPAVTLLDRLTSRDLLVLDDENTWVFKSDLLRDVAYETLTKAERARRHYQAATALGLTGGPSAGATDYAGHDLGQAEQRATHLARAAELAMTLGTVQGLPDDLNEQALSAILLAISLERDRGQSESVVALAQLGLKLAPDSKQAELHLAHADALIDIGSHGRAKLELDTLEQSSLTVAQRAELLMIRGEMLRREGSVGGSIEVLLSSLALWEQEADYADKAKEGRARRALGLAYMFRGDYLAATNQIRTALQDALARHDRRSEAWARQNLAWTELLLGNFVQAEAHIEDAIEAFSEVEDLGGLAWTYGLIGWVRFFQGRLDEALDVVESGSNGWGVQDRLGEALTKALQGVLSLWTGQVPEAIEQIDSAYVLLERMPDPWPKMLTLHAYARALGSAGRISEALERFNELDELSRRFPELPLGQTSGAARGLLLTQLGEPVEALRMLNLRPFSTPEFLTARALAELQCNNAPAARSAIAEMQSMVVDLNPYEALALGFFELAEGSVDEALQWAAKAASGTYLDRTMMYWICALAAAQRGEPEETRTKIAAAWATIDGTGARWDQAVTRLMEAICLESIGDPGAETARVSSGARLAAFGRLAEGWSELFTRCATPREA